MDPENPSENLPEEPPEGLTDRYKRKLRRLLEVVSKQPKSVVSTLKTELKSASRAILNTIKRWINTVKVKSRRLSETLSKRSKSTFSESKTALKSVLDSIKRQLARLSGAKNSLNKWFDTKKDKLRKIKRELIIWVISVAAISLVAAITNFILEKQQVAGQRIWQLERQLEDTIEEKTLLESKLAQIPRLREHLTNLFEEEQLRTVIKEKRAAENKLNDTVAQLEKTVGQLEQMGRVEEHLANNVKEITRLRENLSQLEQERASVEPLARLANSWLEPKDQIQDTKAAIETKRLVEKKLKDTAGELEKTAQQLEGMGQLKEQFASNLEEITRLRKDLAEQLDSQRSINELLGWRKTELQGPETKKAQGLPPALDEEKPKVPPIAEAPEMKPGFFKKSTLAVVFAIAIVGVSLLCLFGSRLKLLRKLIERATALVAKKRVPEEELHKFKRLEEISLTILGGLLLKSFENMGYRVSLISGITSGSLTSVLERYNEKALFRYICKGDDFGQRFVEDFAKNMREENASKGYLVTTGAVAEPVLALAKEKSIELVGKEKLVELIPSCLFQEGLRKELEDTKVKLIKQTAILKDEVSQKEALSQELKDSQHTISGLNKKKNFLSEELKTKNAEYSQLQEYIKAQLQKHKGEISGLTSERNSLQEKNSQLQDKLQQSNKDLEQAIYLTEELEEKLAQKDQLQNEAQSYVIKMENEIFPSLNLTPLGDRGVLLKVEPDGPIAALKRIATFGVSFESDRKLEVPSPCNITLIFFGSSNPLTVKGSLIWQKKLPGSFMHNVRFEFLSLRQNEKERINEYIDKTQKLLGEAKR